MQDLIHKPHINTLTHTLTYSPSEYISVSWPPTQLSRLTFCLVFFSLPHTFCLSPPHSDYLSVFCPPDRPRCPLSSCEPATSQCRPLVLALTLGNDLRTGFHMSCREVNEFMSTFISSAPEVRCVFTCACCFVWLAVSTVARRAPKLFPMNLPEGWGMDYGRTHWILMRI